MILRRGMLLYIRISFTGLLLELHTVQSKNVIKISNTYYMSDNLNV
jgi:hypothetical protein